MGEGEQFLFGLGDGLLQLLFLDQVDDFETFQAEQDFLLVGRGLGCGFDCGFDCLIEHVAIFESLDLF